MGKLDGKVAFITGAARGQGRSHAIRLAQEGADVIAIDLLGQLDSVTYPMGTEEELAETVKAVEALDRRIVARQADVRDVASLRAAFEAGTAELGPVDIVLANAGIGAGGSTVPEDQEWDDVVAVNLKGVWNTGRVAIPSMIERGQGGAIVLTSSTGGLVGVGIPTAGFLAYTAAKHGVVGLMRSWANFLAPHNIRVNSVAPTAVRTPMAGEGNLAAIMERSPALANALSNALPVDLIEPLDVSNAIAWLVSDDARYVTGSVIPVDAGQLNKR
jgi:SDR family mycofactocin-dependent oxidoreductase